MPGAESAPVAWRRWTETGQRRHGAGTGHARVRRRLCPASRRGPAPFFTHHQILELVAPFSRSGHRIDMAASRRLQRQLLFQPVPRDDAVETLRLESPRPGFFRLRRTLRRPDGLCATLQAEGDEPAALLQRVQAVPTQQHFDGGEGFAVARSLR